MAISENQILPAIVVEVEECRAPTEKRDGRLGNPQLIADVREIGVAIVAIERFVIVGESGVVKINLTVVLIVAHSDAHGGSFAPALVEGVT